MASHDTVECLQRRGPTTPSAMGAAGLLVALLSVEVALAQVDPPPPLDPQHRACLDYAMASPEVGLEAAREGVRRGGGWAAQHCEAVAFLALGRPAQAASILEALGRSAGPHPLVRAALLRDAARAFLAAGDAHAGQAAATRGLILTPDDPALLTERAIAAATLGDLFAALDDLSRAIELMPDQPSLLVLRAAAWRRVGQPSLAEDDARRALELDPASAEAQLELGLLALERGAIASARIAFLRVRELDPDSAAASLAQRHLDELTLRR